MKLTEILSENRIKHAFNTTLADRSPIIALTETAIEHNISVDNVITLLEVAPTAPGAEDWINSVKSDFKKRYGDDWQKVLYATAWKRFGESVVTETTTKSSLNDALAAYPEELVAYFKDEDTFSGYVADNRLIGRISKKLLDGFEFKPGPIMRVAEMIKDYNRANGGSIGNSAKERHAARSDRLLRVRDSSGKATARKF